MAELKTFEYLVGVPFDLLLREVFFLLFICSDHAFEVICHVFKHNVLNQLSAVSFRVEEVLGQL